MFGAQIGPLKAAAWSSTACSLGPAVADVWGGGRLVWGGPREVGAMIVRMSVPSVDDVVRSAATPASASCVSCTATTAESFAARRPRRTGSPSGGERHRPHQSYDGDERLRPAAAGGGHRPGRRGTPGSRPGQLCAAALRAAQRRCCIAIRSGTTALRAACPRSFLRRMEERLARHGWQLHAALEAEFSLLQPGDGRLEPFDGRCVSAASRWPPAPLPTTW